MNYTERWKFSQIFQLIRAIGTAVAPPAPRTIALINCFEFKFISQALQVTTNTQRLEHIALTRGKWNGHCLSYHQAEAGAERVCVCVLHTVKSYGNNGN